MVNSAPISAESHASGWKIPIFPSRPPSSSYKRPDLGGKREIDFASEPLPLEASLRQRIDVWRNAPGGRGEVDGEVELGGFMQWNLEVGWNQAVC